MRPSSEFAVTLRFHGDLGFFLKNACGGAEVVRLLGEKTSVKDVIESCGVPHPEVDLIVADGRAVGFEFHLVASANIDVYPIFTGPLNLSTGRLQTRSHARFAADGHLGKLARDLRLLGFDTAYRNDADDGWLVRTAVEEERALLTRDRRLLMHAVIRHGYCPRSHLAHEQITEVVRRFELSDSIQPYTRCLRCNGLVQHAEKESVMDQLEPLTKRYYANFRRCIDCGRVYWAGSHFQKLAARIDAIRRQLEIGRGAERG